MQFVWAKDGEEQNTRLIFKLILKEHCDTLVVCAADFYQVYLDGNFVSYGPERAAAGFSKKREINIVNIKEIIIKVVSYNVPCYSCDYQKAFFGAEVLLNNKVVYDTQDFDCYFQYDAIRKMPRYCKQRGFVEGFDLYNINAIKASTYATESPLVIEGRGDVCDYETEDLKFIKKSKFNGFDKVEIPEWTTREDSLPQKDEFSVEKDFLEVSIGADCEDYKMECEHSGFLSLKIKAKTDIKVFAVFEEILIDGKWIFRRSGCNDFVYIKAPKGQYEIITFEPYAFQYLKLIVVGDAEIIPTLIKLENSHADFVKVTGNKKIETVFLAAKNTFCQNCIDIFMDCPGRERAGWLCDSYFTAMSERLFTGENKTEREFLYNYINTNGIEGVDKGMLPMCFPSKQRRGLFIPNWAMWFVLELKRYYEDTNDYGLVKLAKTKVFELVSFFDKFINEFGLLEDLEGWIFVEWSICNNKDYVCGVNFPTNILFSQMLQCVGELYENKEFIVRSKKIREAILKFSYNGEFFVDNAMRFDGKLKPVQDHISETCQYYMLYFGLTPDKNFETRMEETFGPLRDDGYCEIGKSNMFIGNYLRFFWLCSRKKYQRVMDEMLAYFYGMANQTGTLWEHDRPQASCNHGFASVAAVLLMRCLCGYQTIKDGVVVLDEEATLKPYFKELNIIFKKK